MTAESEHYRLFPLIPFDPQHGVEVYYVEIDPGTTYDGEPHKGNVEENIFVIPSVFLAEQAPGLSES